MLLWYLVQCFPTKHSLRTRTQVRHKCTQVHGGNRSSKLAKSKSVPCGADKPLICHSERRYMRAKSRILSRCKPCACMLSLAGFYRLQHVNTFCTRFSKGTTWTLNALQPLLHSPKMLKYRYQHKSHKLDRTMNDSLWRNVVQWPMSTTGQTCVLWGRQI